MKKQLLINATLAFCLGLMSNESFAQDECGTAVNLSSSSVSGLTTAGSTSSTGAMGQMCSQIDRDVWYKFTPSSSTTTTVKVTPTNSGDPVLEIYTGCSSGQRINRHGGGICSDDNSNGGSEQFTNLSVTAGTTYYVRIGEYQTGGGTINFGITLSGTVLPIELTAFNATTEGAKNHLTWATASETNNKGFNIERSRDGETFQSIGTVKAIGKAGNYNFTDAEPVNGTNYYRLRQIDYDGTATYSKVVSVANKGGKALKVYPTLVSNGFLTVDTDGTSRESREGGDYAIYNVFGQQVQNGKTTQRLDVSALAKGTYILKVGAEQAKFVKQ